MGYSRQSIPVEWVQVAGKGAYGNTYFGQRSVGFYVAINPYYGQPTKSPTPEPTRYPTTGSPTAQTVSQSNQNEKISDPNKGRCGPLFGGRSCDCTGWELYCNTANGWCGQTNAHKNAQRGDEYDCPIN